MVTGIGLRSGTSSSQATGYQFSSQLNWPAGDGSASVDVEGVAVGAEEGGEASILTRHERKGLAVKGFGKGDRRRDTKRCEGRTGCAHGAMKAVAIGDMAEE